MTAITSDRLMSAEKLEQLSEDDCIYELSRGSLIRSPLLFTWPGIIASNIAALIGAHVRAGHLGVCGTACGGLKLASDPDTVRTSSLWFIRTNRLPVPLPRHCYWEVAPDLAVQVLSESTQWATVIGKVADYLHAGTALMWVIDPEARLAVTFSADRPPQFVTADGRLDGADVLPGFSLALADIFG